MNEALILKIQFLLLKWFRSNKRPLPWRKTWDPYKIWISEVMLQQTQVDTVIPYYERWTKNFPNLTKLARSPLSRVLKCWEGLGYYSRARNLHRAAKIVIGKLEGKFPDRVEELQKLPGIGRYTAGAIASIAFNQPEPVLDGNVKRVLSRVFAIKEPIDKTDGKKKLWEIATTLVGAPLRGRPRFTGRPHRAAPTDKESKWRPGDWNQALMELGALVCFPGNPKCFICPLKKICKVHRIKKEDEFPVKARREKTEKLKTVATVIWKNGRVLLQRQPLEARWGGLWIFPQWTLRNGKREAEFLEERLRTELGLRVRTLKPKMELEHGFTKYRVRLRVYEGRAYPGVIARRPIGRRSNLRTEIASASFGMLPRNDNRGCTRWLNPKRLSCLPLPAPHQKIAQLIQNHA